MKLNHYETTIIISPSLPKNEVQSTIKKYEKFLKQEKAEILHQIDQGAQNLAYPIQKKTSGIYHITQYKAPTSVVAKLERSYRIDENIIRFLSVKLDKHGIDYHEKKRDPNTQTPPQRTEEEVTKSHKEDNSKKYCRFEKFNIKYIDYKEKSFLLRFLNSQGKVLPRRITGNKAKSQKMVNQAVKRSRHIALLPFVTDNLK